MDDDKMPAAPPRKAAAVCAAEVYASAKGTPRWQIAAAAAVARVSAGRPTSGDTDQDVADYLATQMTETDFDAAIARVR